MRRLCGPLLMATGVLHLLMGILVLYSRPLADIARDGFFGAVEPQTLASTFDREAAVWFVMFGLLTLILGGLVHWAQARTGFLPAFLGWSVLLLSLVGLILMPLSGFWVVLPPAVMMILVSRRAGSPDVGQVSGTGDPTVGYRADPTSPARRT